MINTYSKFTLCVLTQEQHERTCGYWFVVTTSTLSHTAFRTAAGLQRWLTERNLSLTAPLTEAGTWSVQEIIGTYRQEMHYTDEEQAAFVELHTVDVSRTLSNGDYVVAKITQDIDGIRTVHTLNPNVPRETFHYASSNVMMS